MTYALGVDLGTTFTAAAVCEPGARPRPVKLGDSADAVPSVLFDRGGDLLFGEKAELRATSDPTSVIRYAKTRLGSDTAIVAGGRTHQPAEVMGFALRWVVDRAAKVQGEPPSAVTLTHPAHWGQHHLSRMEEVAAQAGIGKPSFLAEPEAAGIQYVSSERVDAGELVGVYDLGGGTFDGAIIRRTAIGFALQGKPAGLDYVGGNVFDDAIFEYVCENVDLSGLADNPANNAAAYALRDRCRDAKRLLSEDTVADIPLLFPDFNTSIRVNRADFESLISVRLNDTIDRFGTVIRSAGVTSSDLKSVLMVGGSSRIPLVAQMLRAAIDCPLAFDLEPKMVVASGAAASAARELERLPSLNPAGSRVPAAVAPTNPATAPPVFPPPVAGAEPTLLPPPAGSTLLPPLPDQQSVSAPSAQAFSSQPMSPLNEAVPPIEPAPLSADGGFDLASVSAESRHRPLIKPASAMTTPPQTTAAAIETLPTETSQTAKLVGIGVVALLVAVIAVIVLLSS